LESRGGGSGCSGAAGGTGNAGRQCRQCRQRSASPALSAAPRKNKGPAQAQLRPSSDSAAWRRARRRWAEGTEQRDAQAIPAVAMTRRPIAPCACPPSALQLRVALPTPHAWYHSHCTHDSHDTHGTHLALALQAPNHALALVVVVGFHTPCPALDIGRCRRRLSGHAAAAAAATFQCPCQCRDYTPC
jgi:hypothetical protein